MAGNPMDVVDYNAWQRGYMPPSEHILIDALAFRGAKVRASTHLREGHGWWIVTQGDVFDNDEMWEMIEWIAERKLKRIRERRTAAIAVGEAIASFGTTVSSTAPSPPSPSQETSAPSDVVTDQGEK
ncbi:MAG: hypothetical protein BroJett013_06700 [Alphaproteobacteria bacterium]|nr:MAG: hypothetical protein BroJett013_06700 [Alphaproteobacteria bacterium]